MSLFRGFLNANKQASTWLDRRLPVSARIDGNQTFRETIPDYVAVPGARVYDIGGGSQPAISAALKAQYKLTCIGVDIDGDELSKAPEGLYDETITADICTFRGNGDGDLIICQAVLEHVSDGRAALEGIVSLARPGGRIHIFVPCRNALFARLNLVLPQGVKTRLLYGVFPDPEVVEHQGFPASYDGCVPSTMTASLEALGCDDIRVRTFWMSRYFFIFLPAHVFWRAWQGVGRVLFRNDAAETFILSATRGNRPQAAPLRFSQEGSDDFT